MMNRRSFLAAILAASAAPAIVRASSLMPLWTPREDFFVPWSGDSLSIVCSMAEAQAEVNRICGITVEYMMRNGQQGVIQSALVPTAREIFEIGKLPAGAVIRRVTAPIGVEVDQAWLAPVDRETRARGVIAYRPLMAPAGEPS